MDMDLSPILAFKMDMDLSCCPKLETLLASVEILDFVMAQHRNEGFTEIPWKYRVLLVRNYVVETSVFIAHVIAKMHPYIAKMPPLYA